MCFGLAAGVAHADAAPPDFSGDWIATDASGAAATSTAPGQDHARGSHRGGAGGGGMGTGRMGGGHSHGNRTSSTAEATPASAGGFAALVPRDHAEAFIVRPSEDVFDIEANGRRMAYRFDGKHNYGPQYGGTVALHWSAPELVIETHPDGSAASFEEHYALSRDGKQLTWTLRSKSGPDAPAQEQNRVFVRRETK